MWTIGLRWVRRTRPGRLQASAISSRKAAMGSVGARKKRRCQRGGGTFYIVEAMGRRLCCEQRDGTRKGEMLMRKQNRPIGQGKQLWRVLLLGAVMVAVLVIVVLRLCGAPVCQDQGCAALSSRPAKHRAGARRDGEGETR